MAGLLPDRAIDWLIADLGLGEPSAATAAAPRSQKPSELASR